MILLYFYIFLAFREVVRMGKLDNIEPKEVFCFFEKLCSIPHGSGNVQKISDYLVSFARERNLEVEQDKELNVIIKAPGTADYEDKEPVILQGHMDMVAVKEDNCDINMETDGLKVTTDGEYVWAEGTSLGGDDGIAVAYCLALLDSKDIPHPPLEVVITTNEETGMYGAAAIDLSGLKSKKLINIDNEEEGVFITSCAGGARFYSDFDLGNACKKEGTEIEVKVEGLLGGHSGEMIIKGRGNANIILARTLAEAMDRVSVSVISLNGGVADNAIPSSSTAKVVVDHKDAEEFIKSVEKTLEDVRGELEGKDDKLVISAVKGSEGSFDCYGEADSRRIVNAIISCPDGVQAMSAAVEGLVETSLNLGIIKTEGSKVTVTWSVRSSVESAKMMLIRKLSVISDIYGGKYTITGKYPGWKFRQDSDLREHMVKVYRDLYGKEPKIEAIHAGLECGLLSEKIEGLDCISIGPDMMDIHSTKEKLSVKSTKSVWDYLKAVLK